MDNGLRQAEVADEVRLRSSTNASRAVCDGLPSHVHFAESTNFMKLRFGLCFARTVAR